MSDVKIPDANIQHWQQKFPCTCMYDCLVFVYYFPGPVRGLCFDPRAAQEWTSAPKANLSLQHHRSQACEESCWQCWECSPNQRWGLCFFICYVVLDRSWFFSDDKSFIYSRMGPDSSSVLTLFPPGCRLCQMYHRLRNIWRLTFISHNSPYLKSVWIYQTFYYFLEALRGHWHFVLHVYKYVTSLLFW